MISRNKSRSLFSSILIGLLILIVTVTGCAAPSTTTGEIIQLTCVVNNPVIATTPVSVSVAPETTPVATTSPTTPVVKSIILATTTSTQDTGLLDVLIPMFEAETGYVVKTVAVGTGAAIAMGQRGEADVLLVHDYTKEVPLINSGVAINRMLLMHNDFLIAGPASDPAGIKGMTSAVDAYKKIAAAKSLFVSRGDASGTNSSELRIWKTAGITPKGQTWYQETGSSMGATLAIAAEKGGYVYTDRATYLSTKTTSGLAILMENPADPPLLNVYHVMQVNPGAFKNINAEGGRAFVWFMISQKALEVIRTFGEDKYGQALFFIDIGKTEASLGIQ